ncbi:MULTISPECIES: hypothetical protein [unclassified Anabaena]|uniref:hypothetical protein n=1 Tax=unclassified Anabaena TaxID=2619674 RepID=UPI00082DF3BB|nr:MULTISPECIES: hypothetical protein [unclassified Anabaena]
MLNSAQNKAKEIIQNVVETTQEKTTEITEEAIFQAVDQALNVIEIASKRVRERNIPTEKVSLEVSVNIMGLIELKMQANVPNQEEVKEVILAVNHNSHQ